MKRFLTRKTKKVTKILLIVIFSSCNLPKSLFAADIFIDSKIDSLLLSFSSDLTKLYLTSNGVILTEATAINQLSALEIENHGSIISNFVQAIYSGRNSSQLSVKNYGTIKGKTIAINVVMKSFKTTEIVNEEGGIIKGAILFVGNAASNSSITNSGYIEGDISSTNSLNTLSIINNAGSITGNIDLGSNSSSSFTLNDGTINGNLTSANSAQKISLIGGVFNGNISSVSGSTINLGNVEFNGNIDSDISLIAGSGLNGETKINGIVNGNISLLSNSSLSLGNSTVNGVINSNSSGLNKISTIIGTNIINNSAAIVQNSSENSRLEIRNYGLIKSNNAQAMYSDGKSSELLVINNGVIESKNASIHIAARSSKQTEIINEVGGIIKGAILFTGDAVSNSSITNNGNISGNISLDLASNNNFSMINNGFIEGDISSTNSLNKLSIINNAGSITGNIDLGSNSSSSFTLNDGTINGNLTSSNSAQKISLVSGTFNGNVSSFSGSTINLGNTKINGILDISSNSILNLESNNIYANNISLNGILNFGGGSKIITGNISGNGNGVMNLGDSSHNINGNLSLKSGDSINLTLASDNNFGKLKISGVTSVDSNVKLNIVASPSYKFIADGTKYKIIDGENGSSVNQINDSNININNLNSNQFSLLTFTTSSVNNDLVLNAQRKSAEIVTPDKTSQNAYNNINNIGSSATGELRLLQEYLDKSVSNNQVKETLNSVTPQEKSGIKLSHVNIINNSVKTAENRMDEIHLASLNENNKKLSDTNITKVFYDKNKSYSLKKLSGISLGDSKEDNGIWAQTFGTVAKQGNINENDGYSSQSLGFAFGYDKEITKNSSLGLSLSYGNSNIKSSDAMKKTDINTYQINAYSGHSFGKYFFDTIVGFAWNNYNSNRTISTINSVASAKYNGQTYIAKLRGGFVENIGNGFSITPETSINFVRNNTDSYTENGSGTLNLSVKGNSTNFLEGRVGLNLGHRIKTKNNQISSKINISYGYNFLNDQVTTTANFVGQTATFNSLSSKIDPKSLKLGAGIDIYGSNSFMISSEYIMEKREKFKSHSGVLKFRFEY